MLDERPQVAYPVIFLAPSDVECLVVYQVFRGMQHCEECARDVFDMHERAPRSTVALNQDFARCERNSDQVVHHYIGTKPR